MSGQVEVWSLIFNFVAPDDCARCESVCKQWQACLINRNQWWQKKCQEDYSLVEAVGPAQQPCSTYKMAYGLWHSRFADLDQDLVRRSCAMWSTLKAWLKKHGANDIYNSLQAGLAKEDVENIQSHLGIELPQCVQVVYRVHNGCSGRVGLLGGYEFYHHLINLKLDELIANKNLLVNKNFVVYNDQLIISKSFPVTQKMVTVDCNSGDVWIPSLQEPIYWWSANPVGGTGKKDGFLCWMEEYVSRLKNGSYELEIQKSGLQDIHRVGLFPKSGAMTSVAVTHGIQVRTSVVFVPELSRKDRFHNQLVFTYSISFKMVEETQEFKKAQLVNRCWTIINSEDEEPDRVEGPGVVGQHPIVSMDTEEFVYQSCTSQRKNGGYMYGHFDFIQGTIDQPTGPIMQIQCPRFDLILPQFIY